MRTECRIEVVESLQGHKDHVTQLRKYFCEVILDRRLRHFRRTPHLTYSAHSSYPQLLIGHLVKPVRAQLRARPSTPYRSWRRRVPVRVGDRHCDTAWEIPWSYGCTIVPYCRYGMRLPERRTTSYLAILT